MGGKVKGVIHGAFGFLWGYPVFKVIKVALEVFGWQGVVFHSAVRQGIDFPHLL